MKEFRYDVLTLHIVVIILSTRGEIHVNAYELADELEQVLNAAGLKDNRVPAMLRQQADQIAELEKDLYMIQRHYDQLETFSPSGKNAQGVSNAKENLPKGNI